MFVGDFLRQLERKDEIVRRFLRPTSHGLGRRSSIERRVDLDGLEGASVDGKEISRSRPYGIERSHPRVVVPALGSDMNFAGHGMNRHIPLKDVKSSYGCARSRSCPDYTLGRPGRAKQ